VGPRGRGGADALPRVQAVAFVSPPPASISPVARGPERILQGLNPAQREATVAARGPLAIVAGAGTGKTTTITRRIAYQVASGAVDAGSVLAVTFTEKAAGELRQRLVALGVGGVEARTFHSAALGQISALLPRHAGTQVGEILDGKAPIIASLANALPPPHKFVPRRDLASEIEWAKNRMAGPRAYLDELAATGHQPPIPTELMHRIYEGYERRKERMGRLDFEDMLALAIRLFDEHPAAAAELRSRYGSFTVDEYQDVNPLQDALLTRWLGDRDDLCVVGDDHQTIYGFTGASPSYLLEFARRFPKARVVRLEENYRSSPQVLDVANRLGVGLGGYRKVLRATAGPGPAPVVRAVADQEVETRFVLDEVRRLSDEGGVALEEIAVLYRINARSDPFEEAFARAGIAYQVRDGGFLRRPGPRSLLHRLRQERGSVPIAEAVERITDSVGYREGGEPDGSEEEVTRQADLGRLRSLAREFQDAGGSDGVDGFVADLTRRFSTESTGRGVNLMTYHRAKGLEFDAVFLPRLLEGELPFRSGRSQAPVDEERRLLYVGVTRARRYLYVTWPLGGKGRSSFVDELVDPADRAAMASLAASRPVAASRPAGHTEATVDDALLTALKRWRRERAREDAVPAYVVFHDATLAAIADRRPRTRMELRGLPGIGPAKLERYGDEVLAVVASGAGD
jgi:DNA helicase-2/ATP-dependent DNA helicase PcrA